MTKHLGIIDYLAWVLQREIFISRIENPPSVLEYIYNQILLPKILCISLEMQE